MEDRYGMSPFEMMSLLGPAMVIVPMLLWFLVVGPLVLYPVARWRANREAHPDAQLGMKVALHYFKLLAFQLLLIGGTMLLYAIISKMNEKGELYRAAFGFLVPAGIVFGAHMMLIKKTNDEVMPGVRRLYLGYNLLVTGILGFVALVLGFQALFAKGDVGDPGRFFLASIMVYCAAWVAIGVQFSRLVLGPGAGGMPRNIVPPSPGPSATDASGSVSAQPGLPPLSAGQYPPIDPNR
jgi:hypothetical protein